MRILFWFRKDLRLDDNTGLAEAARDARGDVVPFYASEPDTLSRPDMAATRARFVLESLADLAAAVEGCGSHLALSHGSAVETVIQAARAARADAVYWNDDYEPQLVVEGHTDPVRRPPPSPPSGEDRGADLRLRRRRRPVTRGDVPETAQGVSRNGVLGRPAGERRGSTIGSRWEGVFGPASGKSACCPATS